MFKIFKMKPKTTAEVKIEQVVKILFPPLELHVDKEGNKFHIDHSVDTNLEAALMDLQEGHNDKAVHNTIMDIEDRLIQVRKILDEHMQICLKCILEIYWVCFVLDLVFHCTKIFFFFHQIINNVNFGANGK